MSSNLRDCNIADTVEVSTAARRAMLCVQLRLATTIKLRSLIVKGSLVVVTQSHRQQAKKSQIRDAARRLFLEHGYAGTSMDAVTAAAGVSKQTVYTYYPSKRVLFADVLEHASVAHPEYQALAYLEHAHPETRDELQEVLTEFAERAVKTMLQTEYLSLLRVLIPEVRAHPDLSELFQETVTRRGLRRIGALIDDAAKRGIIGSVDPDAAARLFFGPLLTYLLLDGLLAAEQPAHIPDRQRIYGLVALAMGALPTPS